MCSYIFDVIATIFMMYYVVGTCKVLTEFRNNGAPIVVIIAMSISALTGYYGFIVAEYEIRKWFEENLNL